MKKIFFYIIAATTCFVSFEAMAQAYQRKQVKPNFFIPEKDIAQKKEVLPDIVIKQPVYEEVITEPVKKADTSKIEQSGLNFPAPDNTVYKVGETSPNGSYRPQQDPTYLRKYDEYISDLKIIGENGSAPINKNLQNDLAKMNSNARFEVSDDFGANPSVPQKAKNTKVKMQ